MMVVKAWYAKPTALIGTPHLPRDHLAGGNGSPKSRRQRTHPVLMAYVPPTAPFIKPMMLLKTSEPPKFRRARMTKMNKDAICESCFSTGSESQF